MELKDIGKFFRIFDLAFFIPGAALLASLIALFLSPDQFMALQKTLAETQLVGGVSFAVVTMVITYILGVACHALGRFMHRLLPAPKTMEFNVEDPDTVGQEDLPWYQNLSQDKLVDHTLYLWVLASTSLNLAAACFIVGVLTVAHSPPGRSSWHWTTATVFGFFVFIYGYWDFRAGYRGFAAGIRPADSKETETTQKSG